MSQRFKSVHVTFESATHSRVVPLTVRTVERNLTPGLFRSGHEPTQDLELLERLRTTSERISLCNTFQVKDTHMSFQHCSSLAHPAQRVQNAVTLSYRLCFSCTVS